MFMYYSNTFLFVLHVYTFQLLIVTGEDMRIIIIIIIIIHVYMTTFSPDSVCLHHTRMGYLDDRDYDAESGSMEEILAGGCSYVYLVGDFSFGLLPEDELPRDPLCNEDSAYGGIG